MPETGAEAHVAVRLQLYADLRRFLPAGKSGPLEFSLREGSTVATLLATAGIPTGEEITISLNGEQAQRHSLLRDGDEVVLFSPMEGG